MCFSSIMAQHLFDKQEKTKHQCPGFQVALPTNLHSAEQHRRFKSNFNIWKIRGRIWPRSFSALYCPLPSTRWFFQSSLVSNKQTARLNDSQIVNATQASSQISRVRNWRHTGFLILLLHKVLKISTPEHTSTRTVQTASLKSRAKVTESPCTVTPLTRGFCSHSFSIEYRHKGLNPGDLQTGKLNLAQLCETLALHRHTFLPAWVDLRAKGFLFQRSRSWFIASCSCN